MGVCSQDNTHPGGTERSESRAFDSHVVERNKTGALVDLQNKGRSEKNILGAKERKKNLQWACLKVPLAVSVTLSRRLKGYYCVEQ